jgi:molybdenum cofactor biosynthesis enzyme MoaA
MHPFTGLATREDGAILACCRSQPIGWIQNNSLEEIWNNDAIKNIRHQVLNNQRPKECDACFSLEDHGVESLRQRHITNNIPESRINLYPDALDDLNSNYEMPFKIPTMEIKLNNLCNLKCRMCHPMDSTSWNDWEEVEEFYAKEGNFMVKAIRDLNLIRKPYLDKFDDTINWWTSFEKLLPYFRRVEFAGGEPLMDPQHYRILDMLKPYGNNIELKYATNGTTLGISKGRNIHNYWKDFKSIAINISIDGIDDVYNYIRGNGNWDQIVNNIQEFKKIPNINRIVGAVAVQISNILILDEMIECFLNDLGIVFYTNLVKYPNVLSIQVLPYDLKKLVIKKLKIVKTRVHKFKYVKENPILHKITIKQINGIINFIIAEDLNYLWKDCVEFNRRLDKTRNQNFLNITPEFKNYV